MGEPRQVASRIPVFNSIEEEAEFWDTHDSTEFEDEVEPVEVEISPEVRSRFIVTIELERATWDELRALARRRGVRLADLAREWVLDGYARATAEADIVAPTGADRTN